MSQDDTTTWQAKFHINPHLNVREIKNLSNIRLIKNSDNNDALATELEITITAPTREDAHNKAIEIANKCVAFLTFRKRFLVTASLYNIGPQPSGITMTGYSSLAITAIIDKYDNIDLTAEPLPGIINNSEDKLSRQLSHYHRAFQTDDVMTKIREFYQVIEDEYNNTGDFIESHKLVRHLVSHPKLHDHKLVKDAKAQFGKEYLDPSEDLSNLKPILSEIQKEAEKILEGKIPLK